MAAPFPGQPFIVSIYNHYCPVKVEKLFFLLQLSDNQ